MWRFRHGKGLDRYQWLNFECGCALIKRWPNLQCLYDLQGHPAHIHQFKLFDKLQFGNKSDFVTISVIHAKKSNIIQPFCQIRLRHWMLFDELREALFDANSCHAMAKVVENFDKVASPVVFRPEFVVEYHRLLRFQFRVAIFSRISESSVCIAQNVQPALVQILTNFYQTIIIQV